MNYDERREWADLRTPKLVEWTEKALGREQEKGEWRPRIRFRLTGEALDVIGVDATGLHCGFRCRRAEIALARYQDVTFRRYLGPFEEKKFIEGLHLLDLNAYAVFEDRLMVRAVVHRVSERLKEYIEEQAVSNFTRNRSGPNGFVSVRMDHLRRAGLVISEFGWSASTCVSSPNGTAEGLNQLSLF